MTAAVAETTREASPTTAAHRARASEPETHRVTETRGVTPVDAEHDAEKARNERLAAAAQRRAAARTRDLTALLRERPDLVGAHAPADFAVDAVRWCA